MRKRIKGLLAAVAYPDGKSNHHIEITKHNQLKFGVSKQIKTHTNEQ